MTFSWRNKMETVLVTGGSGYIGGWCIVDLLQRGYAVRTTVRSLNKEADVRTAVASALDDSINLNERLTVVRADLTADAGWDEAVAGCDYVMHVASPLASSMPKNPDDLIIPARDGSMRVIKAATKAGVKRVVVTSSVAAAGPAPDAQDCVNDENTWTDLSNNNVDIYRQSKTLAERAIWSFMETYQGPTTVVTILPTAVLGPVLSPDNLGSVQIISRLLSGQFPGTPRLGFNVVDVRDLADIHWRAMTIPEAAGKRFIATGSFMWLSEMSKLLREKLGARARKVPSLPLPDFVLHIAAFFDPLLKFVTPGLGRKHEFTAARAEKILGWKSRSTANTVIDCAESLFEKKAVVV
jgi:dihydroflavonol-4-reductase